jgi:methionyl-tRNA formyltransferase
MSDLRIAYAANRQIGLSGLKLLIDHDCVPSVLVTAKGNRAECSDAMKALLPDTPLIEGKQFREKEGIRMLEDLDIDYFLSVHFPYIIPQRVLDIPRVGTLNLHPAYLPCNRGWHTPTWAIWDGTPYGATLHWIENDAAVDNGPIAVRRELLVRAEETAHELYQRVLSLELEVLQDALPLLLEDRLPRKPQEDERATAHTQTDIRTIQEIDLAEPKVGEEFIRQLRALTTNDWREAAYFEIDEVRYYVQIEIRRDDKV